MATKFWYGGTGNWGSGTAHWSLNSGNSPASTTTTPAAGDNVTFDANSGTGTVTINTNANCHSFDASAASTSLQFASSGTSSLTVGGAGSLSSAAVFKLQSGGTWNTSGNTAFSLQFDNRSGGTTVTTNGVTLQGLGNGVIIKTTNTGAWTNVGDCNIGSGSFQINSSGATTVGSGTTLTCGQFSTSAGNGFTISNANINCTAFVNNVSAVTGNASSTIVCTGNFSTGGVTYPGSVTIYGSASNYMYESASNGTLISGGGTFANLGLGSLASNNSYIYISGNYTVTGSSPGLQIAGNTQTQRIHLYQFLSGTQTTITCNGAFSISNADFRDIKAAGTAGTWSGTSLGDALGNSNITFTPAVTRYGVMPGSGATGNSDASIWSASSGGSTGASMPLPQDSIVFDNNTFNANAQTFLVNGLSCASFDATAVTNFTFKVTVTTSDDFEFYGNINLGSNCTNFGSVKSTMYFAARGAQSFTTGGAIVNGGNFVVDHNSTNLSLADAFSVSTSSNLTAVLVGGTLTATSSARFAGISCIINSLFKVFVGATGGTLFLDSNDNTQTSLVGTTTYLVDFASALTTVVPNGMSISLAPVGTTRTLYLTAGTTTGAWGDVTIQETVGSPSTAIFVCNSNSTTATINSLNRGSGAIAVTPTYTFQAGSTFVLNVPRFVSGAAGNLPVIASTTAGSAFTLNCAAGYVATNYISLKDCTASGKTPFYAGAGSTNVSGNTNWLFTAPPPGKPATPTRVSKQLIASIRSNSW